MVDQESVTKTPEPGPRPRTLTPQDGQPCIHCKRNTLAMCPRCRKRSCATQDCLAVHERICPEKS